MNLNDLKASGQASEVTNITDNDGAVKVSTIPSKKDSIIKVDNISQSSERRVVSINDMIEAGFVSEPEIEPGTVDKIVEQVFDPHSLDESLERRKKQIEESVEKEFYEKAMGEKEAENEEFVEDYESEYNVEIQDDDVVLEASDEEFDPDYDGGDNYIDDYDDQEISYSDPVQEVERTMYIHDHEEITEENIEEEKDDMEVTSQTNTTTMISTTSVIDNDKVESSNDSFKDIDFEDELKKLDATDAVDSVDEDTDKETFEKLSKLLAEKLKVNKHDLSGFTVIKRPVSLSNALAMSNVENAPRTADWALYYTGVPITISSFSGDELEAINNASSNRNRANSIKDVYGRIYNHIISPKPSTYEAWLKSVNYKDVDNLFFAIYRANFEGLNYLPYSCTDDKCGNIFITDNTDIKSMVNFKNKEIEDKFNEIYNSTDYNPNGLFAEKIYPISENYAIGIKPASLYNVFVESNIITDKSFNNKYSTAISILPFIGNFYTIDYNTKSYQPVAFKRYPTNTEKTIKSKIITYSAIMSKLTSDQYSTMLGYVNKMMGTDHDNDITYVMPEVTCPKCGATIEKITDQTPYEMVFTRHRLALAQDM